MNYLKTKRVITLLVAVLMIASLAGCKKNTKGGSGDTSGSSNPSDSKSSTTGEVPTNSDGEPIITEPDQNSTDSNNSQNPTPTSDNTSGNRKVINNAYTTGYPIAKDRVTLKVMIRDHSNGLAKYENTPFIKYIEDKLNVTLKFEAVPPNDMVNQKLILAYSSQTMPDMFWGMAPSQSMHAPYIRQGKLTELSKYINEYGPNIKKMFKDVPVSQYLTTFEDGKTYMLPMVDNPPAGQANYSYKLYINKTWLSNVGKTIPTTTDQLRDVLKAFKDQDANKNGNKNDEIPMTFPGDIPPSLFGPFGVSTYLNWMNINQSTNKVEFSPATDGYRQGMKYFNELFEAGLIDPEVRFRSYDDIKKMTNAKTPTVGVFATSSNYSEAVNAENFLAHYTLMPPLKGSAGAASTWSYVELENTWAEWFMVTSSCKYPEIAVRLADYLYSTEGTLAAVYGPPGDQYAWKYDANGKFVKNMKNLPAGKNFSDYVYTISPSYPIPHYKSAEYYNVINNTPVGSTQEEKANKQHSDMVSAMFKSIKPKHVYPKLSFTQQETQTLADLGNFNLYALEMRFKFLSGEASLETDWDGYINQLKSRAYGLDSYLNVNNQAYNRYRVWLKNNVK